MTHAPYCNGGKLLSRLDMKEWLVEQGLELWGRYAEYYRTLPLKCAILIRTINEGNVRLVIPRKAYLRVVPEAVFRQYKKIPLFEYWNRDDAREYLRSFDATCLTHLLQEIRNIFTYDYAYNQIHSRVQEGNYLIYHDPY